MHLLLRPICTRAVALAPLQLQRPVGFILVGVGLRWRVQLRAFLAEVLETTTLLAPASVCMSFAQSGITGTE